MFLCLYCEKDHKKRTYSHHVTGSGIPVVMRIQVKGHLTLTAAQISDEFHDNIFILLTNWLVFIPAITVRTIILTTSSNYLCLLPWQQGLIKHLH